MNRFLNNNLAWKIVSLILAAILWIFVINTQNPILLNQFDDLPIRIEGIEELEKKGFLLTNEQEIRDTIVKVDVSGPRLEMEQLTTGDDSWEILLDLSAYANTLNPEDASESIERPVLVNVVGEKGSLEIGSISPSTISVLLAKETIEVKNIETNIQGGNTSEYSAQDPILKPTQVEITGAKTDVEKVQRAVVDVNVDNFSEDILTYTLPVRLLDAEGIEVEGVKAEPEKIEVVLPIGKKKQVPLTAKFQGNLPQGYIQSNVIITPAEITVIGKSDLIDNLSEIAVEAIPLSNMIQSGTYQVDVQLPQGVERIDTVDIVVTIEIKKEISYEYTIDTTQLSLKVEGLPEAYTLEIKEPVITVNLVGTPENLLDFSAKGVQATLSLDELGSIEPGSYTAELSLQIPDTIQLANNQVLTLEIEIIDPNAPTEEDSVLEEDTELEEDVEDEQPQQDLLPEDEVTEDEDVFTEGEDVLTEFDDAFTEDEEVFTEVVEGTLVEDTSSEGSQEVEEPTELEDSSEDLSESVGEDIPQDTLEDVFKVSAKNNTAK